MVFTALVECCIELLLDFLGLVEMLLLLLSRCFIASTRLTAAALERFQRQLD